ncbi:MAG: hypothetical protein KKA84_14805 [Bacteroidetes bacterium]|nr:hypothetical protein [Bacteroidota bacterium]
MNKIVLHIGLLIFCLSIVFFAQQGLPAQDVLLKSFVVFVFLTVMISILAIIFLRSINQAALKKNKDV